MSLADRGEKWTVWAINSIPIPFSIIFLFKLQIYRRGDMYVVRMAKYLKQRRRKMRRFLRKINNSLRLNHCIRRLDMMCQWCLVCYSLAERKTKIYFLCTLNPTPSFTAQVWEVSSNLFSCLFGKTLIIIIEIVFQSQYQLWWSNKCFEYFVIFFCQLNISLLLMWINTKASPVLPATAPKHIDTLCFLRKISNETNKRPSSHPCPICMTDYTVVRIALCYTIDVIQWKMNIFISYPMKTLTIHHLHTQNDSQKNIEIHLWWHFMLLAVDYFGFWYKE